MGLQGMQSLNEEPHTVNKEDHGVAQVLTLISPCLVTGVAEQPGK